MKSEKLKSLLEVYGYLQRVYVKLRCELRELAWALEKQFENIGAIRDKINDDIVVFIYRGVAWSINERTLHLMVGPI
ncbi:MAG: hypothetical protein ACXQTI_00365, partial [Candidatus Nezhaarchaeales archaeon]